MNDIENTLTYLLTPISNAYWSNLEKAMNEIKLHSGQVFVLISLWKQDGQSQIELSKNLGLTPPTVNKMVKSLNESGFVISQRGKTDTRIVRVFLTNKGIQIRNLIEEQWLKLETQTLQNFTETEKLILFQLFKQLRTNLTGNVAAE
ncbi:MAG: MarR family transcriptional regulator [Acidobacteriota bacterium]|nr:MarR family transcriptional regulator [Acidobacteriota bacterium]